jgi:hypothetical protein
MGDLNASRIPRAVDALGIVLNPIPPHRLAEVLQQGRYGSDAQTLLSCERSP